MRQIQILAQITCCACNFKSTTTADASIRPGEDEVHLIPDLPEGWTEEKGSTRVRGFYCGHPDCQGKT